MRDTRLEKEQHSHPSQRETIDKESELLSQNYLANLQSQIKMLEADRKNSKGITRWIFKHMMMSQIMKGEQYPEHHQHHAPKKDQITIPGSSLDQTDAGSTSKRNTNRNSDQAKPSSGRSSGRRNSKRANGIISSSDLHNNEVYGEVQNQPSKTDSDEQ